MPSSSSVRPLVAPWSPRRWATGARGVVTFEERQVRLVGATIFGVNLVVTSDLENNGKEFSSEEREFSTITFGKGALFV
jgi:hypothetical protein